MLKTEIQHKLGMVARKIIENGKGILAADESDTSIAKRFEEYGIENTLENRRKFRQILFTTENISEKVGGIILHEETFEQKADSGKLFVDMLIERGIAPGIKLDKGLIDFRNSEKVSVGLEDLEKRLKNEIYRKAEFAKWRSIFTITETSPTEDCINENCSVLARYAEICQKYSIVPIVEPEILWDGKHNVETAEQITKTVLGCLFYHLNLNDIYLPGILVKPAFVTPGKDSKIGLCPMEVGRKTFNCLLNTVPVAVPGIVFLSGGHTPANATMFLDAVNKEKGQRTFKMTFSYGRALTNPALKTWKGQDKNVLAAQHVFKERLDETYEASLGRMKK